MGNFAENLNLGNRFRPPWLKCPEIGESYIFGYILDAKMRIKCVFFFFFWLEYQLCMQNQ